jgi:hypothetical protein
MSLAHLFDQPVVTPKGARLVALEGTGAGAIADRSQAEKLRASRDKQSTEALRRHRDRKAQKA